MIVMSSSPAAQDANIFAINDLLRQIKHVWPALGRSPKGLKGQSVVQQR
jgi:hypothetical protein